MLASVCAHCDLGQVTFAPTSLTQGSGLFLVFFSRRPILSTTSGANVLTVVSAAAVTQWTGKTTLRHYFMIQQRRSAWNIVCLVCVQISHQCGIGCERFLTSRYMGGPSTSPPRWPCSRLILPLLSSITPRSCQSVSLRWTDNPAPTGSPPPLQLCVCNRSLSVIGLCL